MYAMVREPRPTAKFEQDKMIDNQLFSLRLTLLIDCNTVRLWRIELLILFL